MRNGAHFRKLSIVWGITRPLGPSYRRNARTVLMLNGDASATNQTSNAHGAEREARRQAILSALRADAEGILRRMADELVDLPEDKSFGKIEYDLRDLAHELAASAHKAGLAAGKKRATKAPASSAPPASRTPASSSTGPSPG